MNRLHRSIATALAAFLFASGAARASGDPGEAPSPTSSGDEALRQEPESPPAAPSSETAAPDAQRSARDEAASEEEDEALAARALERSLVQRGALLLPVWGVELVPELSYRHASSDAFALRTRTHLLTGALTARLGLPWQMQFEASAPFLRLWQNVLVEGGAGDAIASSGLGDPRLSLTRQILRARQARPDVLLTGTWRAPVAKSPYDVDADEVGLGAGFHGVGGTLTASKTADPLVYLASASYTVNVGTDTERGRLEPGDSLGLGGGAILAVSPQASLSFLIDFRYTPSTRLDGTPALGSDQTTAVLQLGLATIVSRRALLNFAVGVGLTEDTPDLQLGVSMPLTL